MKGRQEERNTGTEGSREERREEERDGETDEGGMEGGRDGEKDERDGGRNSEQIANTSLDGRVVTLEVGSLSLPRFNTFKQQLLECSRKWWENFPINTAETVIRGSHKIWVTRNWTTNCI